MTTAYRSSAFDPIPTLNAQLDLLLQAPGPTLLIDGDDMTVTNALDRSDDPAVLITGNSNIFINQAEATLTGTGTGDAAGSLDGAIEVTGTGNQVQNEAGAVVAGTNGIVGTGPGTSVINGGDILAANVPVTQQFERSTAVSLGDDSSIVNSGLIRAEANRDATAIMMANGGTVDNSGTVEAVGFAAGGVRVSQDGLIVNSGDVVVSASQDGVGLMAGSFGSTVQNSGSVRVSTDALFSNAFGIASLGSNTIWNGGLIEATATGGNAFGVYAFGGSVENQGTINVAALGGSGFSQSVGLVLFSGTGSNAGTIAASSDNAMSIGAIVGADTQFTNTGEILADGPEAIGVNVVGAFVNTGSVTATGAQASGVLAQSDAMVTNSGAITGETTAAFEPSIGIEFTSAAPATKQVINSGTITADVAIIDAVTAPFPVTDMLTVDNSGTINGILDLVTGVDIVTNTGTINGDVDLGSGDDVFDSRGGVVNGTVFGGDGNDIIRAGAGNDILVGGAGADVLAGGAGADVIDGGPGFDFDALDYSDSPAGVQVNLGDATMSTSAPVKAGAGTAFGGDAEGDTFQNILKVIGSDYDDFVYGAPGGSIVELGDGNDVFDNRSSEFSENLIDLGAGNDVARAGAGDDFVQGGTGRDRLYGEDGGDFLLGGEDGDRLYGGLGDDQLDGGSGNDRLYGEDGGDFLLGGEGNDRLHGGVGDDWLDGGSGNDRHFGGAGDDFFVFGPDGGNDKILDFSAGAGSDDVVFLSGFDSIHSFDDVLSIASQIGDDDDDDDDDGVATVLTFDVDTTLTLTGVRIADLNEADFIIF